MTEAIVTIVIGCFMALMAWSIYTDHVDRDRCKELGRIVVHYEHKNYCANIGDLK